MSNPSQQFIADKQQVAPDVQQAAGPSMTR